MDAADAGEVLINDSLENHADVAAAADNIYEGMEGAVGGEDVKLDDPNVYEELPEPMCTPGFDCDGCCDDYMTPVSDYEVPISPDPASPTCLLGAEQGVSHDDDLHRYSDLNGKFF